MLSLPQHSLFMRDSEKLMDILGSSDMGRDRLRLLGLPVFDTIEDLAGLIHLDPQRLRLLVTQTTRFYKKYEIPKKSGGVRKIYQPARELKAIQRWILHYILEKLTPSSAATAFIVGRGLLHNVIPHASNRYFVCIDLADFFPSILDPRVYRIFRLIGYSRETASILKALCTCDAKLPQGGVTSPYLSNLIAGRLDRRLLGLTSRRNISYTRYADDITVSSNNRNALYRSIPLIKEIIGSERFFVNESKTRVTGPRTRCRVTGLVKNSAEPQFGIGKDKKRNMRAVIYSMQKKGVADLKYPSVGSIEGWLAYCKSVDPISYDQLNKYWDRLKGATP